MGRVAQRLCGVAWGFAVSAFGCRPGLAVPVGGACRADPERMFPVSEDTSSPAAAAAVAAAKAVCGGCPVLGWCRVWALAALLSDGVAGGMTAAERREARVAGQLPEPAASRWLVRAVVPRPVAAVLDCHAGHVDATEVDELVVARLAAGGSVTAATRWEVALAAVAMRCAGCSAVTAARRLGVAPRQVERWQARHRAGEPLVGPARRPAHAGGAVV